jgi:Pin2-interacting protein X1
MLSSPANHLLLYVYSSHRARYIASKHLASQSASAISETLGIAPSPSSSSSASPLPQSTQMPGTLTRLDDTLEKLTTSTKSVADYFKDRLRTKASGSSTPLLSSSNEKDDEAHEAPKGGLGSSLLRLELSEVDQEPKMRMGIGASKFGSLMSGTFLASLPTASTIDDLGHPPANKDDFELADEAVETSGQPKEQANPEKAEKKEKRKRDRKGRDKDIERPEPDDEEAEHTRQKEKKAKHKRCHDAVAMMTDKDKDKEARKREKAERKAAKVTRSDA